MAGLGYKDFTAGAVLTAAQVDGYLMEQSVMNFAGTAARGSALSSVQSAGMMAHVGGGTVTVYDGSAWQQVYPAQAGLVYVAGTAFSAVSAVNVNNCFTSTYDNYQIMLTFTAMSADLGVRMRLRVSGSDNTTSNYDSQYLYWNSASVFADANTGSAGNTQWALWSTTESDNPTGAFAVFDVLGPQLTAYTRLTGSNGILTATTNVNYPGINGNIFKATTSFDGFSLLTSTGTISGTVRVYGYRNS